MKNKKTYLMPLLEENEVRVESGIAASVIPEFIIMDNGILDMEEGDAWGAYE